MKVPLTPSLYKTILNCASFLHSHYHKHSSRALRPNLRSLFLPVKMASFTATSISIISLAKPSLVPSARISSPNSVSLSIKGRRFPSITLQPTGRRFQVTCATKQETVQKVCDIVKKQLALPEGSSVTGESKFAALGADSLDTVEIVMGLEEEFGISVEEESAQSITTVQEAADMIDKLLESKTD
ncbi:hypothetical protein HN51_003662 [Arachis hypogaea]|uniref:Acyl carrier protein n=2 Tax=Arachis hypogaea TaxID=3818 RepID=A0A445DK54_ARAHY|nr:Acyl carrier protein 1 [Arachis hypogaea]RYR63558.1 hypothetical protein Ahy_A04g021364 [Arachis hypogaea]